MVTTFTSSYLLGSPGMERQGLTLADSFNLCLIVTFNDLNPLPIGVIKGPLSPTPLITTESIACFDIKSPSLV